MGDVYKLLTTLQKGYSAKVITEKRNGFEIHMTKEEFCQAWKESGKVEQRITGKARSKGNYKKYLMTKVDYNLPLSLANYRIIKQKQLYMELRSGKLSDFDIIEQNRVKAVKKALTGRPKSRAVRDKISASLTGHTKDQETKNKIAESMRRYHSERKKK